MVLLPKVYEMKRTSFQQQRGVKTGFRREEGEPVLSGHCIVHLIVCTG